MSNWVVTAAEMREMDRIAIEDAGIPSLVLMENAGRAVADAVRRLLAERGGDTVTVVCGKGNNGGDGFVAARTLANAGVEVVCLLAVPRVEVKGDALTQLDIVDTLGIPVLEVPDPEAEVVGDALGAADVLVDALFGTGLTSDVTGTCAAVIEKMNALGTPIVAVDLPSGLCADTGAVRGTAVAATITVTFACAKRGLAVGEGRRLSGEVHVAGIGIPIDALEHVGPQAQFNDWGDPLLPPRDRDAHKGDFGHLLVVGGSPGKGGAVLLSGWAALRLGAGAVTIATDARIQPALEGRLPELMIEPAWMPDDVDPAVLLELVTGKSAVVLGPGLSAGEDGAAVTRLMLAAAAEAEVPVVVDATALRHLQPELVPDGARVCLTPHPGEAGHLLGVSSATVQANRFGALAGLLERYPSVVVLKGAGTLIGTPESPVAINRTGNPGMATAGTGDVLAGMIGALAARGLELREAAELAVFLHGRTGDRVAARLGEESLTASDLIAALPGALQPAQEE